MDWIGNMPEPFRTIVSVIIALIALLVLMSPIFIIVFGTSQILMSDSQDEDKE